MKKNNYNPIKMKIQSKNLLNILISRMEITIAEYHLKNITTLNKYKIKYLVSKIKT